MTFNRTYWFYKYKDTGTINGVNDMTKMIGKVDTKKIPKMELGTNGMDVFISEDKLILIEMVVDKLKTIERGESAIISFINEPEEAIDLVCKMSS
jgi:hypothetical protein